MSPKIGSFKLNKWTLKFEFRKSEKNPSQGFVYRWYIENFRHLSWNLSLGETAPFFYNLGAFSAFWGLGAILSELLKVIHIDFRKSGKILPREWSEGDTLKFRTCILKKWVQERMPRFVVYVAFLAIFQRFLG